MVVDRMREDVSFADMLEESLVGKKSIEGTVVSGVVVTINNDKAVIDVGLKSEGRLFLSDIMALKNTQSVQVGEIVDVFIEKFEDRNGEPIISIEKAKKEAIWNDLEKHLEKQTNVEAVIIGRTKGGFSVDINGTAAFLPGSQVDLRVIKDIAPLLNLKQPFKILKMDKQRNNIVVSRRAVLEASRFEAKSEILAKLEEGMVLDGVVKNITDYGAFIDIGGVDGLLHITDMSWKRVSFPAEIVNVGEQVKVQVIKFNRESGRISLGMKQLIQTPWENIEQKYIVGEIYKGKVVNITDYGVFVELDDCIEGMIYITELSWVRKNTHPSKIATINDEIDVIILEVNQQKRKISLGLKQCQENPWKKFAEEFPVGTRLQGVVRNLTEFGIFVGVNDILDGMIHMSDVSWESNIDEKIKDIQKGQIIDVIVLNVNHEKERINLGVKQLSEDPYAAAAATIKKDDIVTASVTSIQFAGVDVLLENGLTGFVKKADLSNDKFKQRSEAFSIGEKIEAIVLNIERDTRKVNLSIKLLEIKREKEVLELFGSDNSNNACFGDILSAAMDKKKEESQER